LTVVKFQDKQDGMSHSRLLPLVLVALPLVATIPFPSFSQEIILDYQRVKSGFSLPLNLTHAGDGTNRLFVVEQRGRIRILDADRNLLPTDFLDLGATGLNRVNQTGNERGLLGLAFHPNFTENGRFFVNYTASDPAISGDSIIAEYHVSPDPNVAEPTETVILGPVSQPYQNHNGGHLAFGLDGYLYIGLGDGGSAGDPQGNGQNINTLLGKILRIDVDSNPPGYAIPPDNPFAGAIPGSDEIYAYGLRNPWRFSFDRQNGRLFCGDVGQDTYEEIDLIGKGDNLGWKIMEGFHCFSPSSGCDMTGLKLPIAEYDRGVGYSVTGGYVYRGGLYPDMFGLYFFADYGTGRIWTLQETTPGTWQRTQRVDTPVSISSFGEDESGEIYFTAYSSGEVYQLRDVPVALTPTPTPTRTATRTATPTKTPSLTATPTPSPTQPLAVSNWRLY
jgi:glucose/arabinose dehydrogenase